MAMVETAFVTTRAEFAAITFSHDFLRVSPFATDVNFSISSILFILSSVVTKDTFRFSRNMLPSDKSAK